MNASMHGKDVQKSHLIPYRQSEQEVWVTNIYY